ncbi:MAG: HK97 gp10 family phage protein [Lachnospiraceae bacterium]|nr:HK97 gp10 family phage protein [Lachnospiraceae bacterium]
MSSFNFTSHASEVKAAKDAAVTKALEMIGLQAEGYAKENITRVGAVDTGRLRNSITHAAEGDDTEVIGTNVEYAPYIEYGTSKMKERPYLTNTTLQIWRGVQRKSGGHKRI